MGLAKDDDMIQALAVDRSDQPFGKAEPVVPNAHSTQLASNDAAINAIPVSHHAARSAVPRKCLRGLTVNQPSDDFAGSSPASPTILKYLNKSVLVSFDR
jgi:hypothetical protein